MGKSVNRVEYKLIKRSCLYFPYLLRLRLLSLFGLVTNVDGKSENRESCK